MLCHLIQLVNSPSDMQSATTYRSSPTGPLQQLKHTPERLHALFCDSMVAPKVTVRLAVSTGTDPDLAN